MSGDFDNKKDTTIKFLLTPESTPRKYAEESEIHEKFEVISQETEEDNDPANKDLLAPDHPFLIKFQKILKDHLVRQVEHLQNEVFEYETGAKKKSSAREDLGIETYEAQQLVNKQQQDLEMCVSELQQICDATEQMENQLDESKESFNKKRLELLELEQNELHLRKEVEGLNLLLHQMKDWEQEVESELVISQKILEKSKKDKSKLCDEKRQLDIFIYKLMTETWKLEEELETMDMQLRVKEDERERLANAVTNSNVDVETMNAEYRCLLHSWNSIIVAISQRDKQHNSVKQELQAINEKIHLTNSEIEQTKKLCHKEMMQNERLTELKGHIEVEIDNCKRLYETECKKREQLESEMNDNQMIMDQIDRDIKRMSAECANKTNILSLAVKSFEKLNREKVDIERQIVQTLDEQLTNNKAAQYLNKLVYDIKEKNADFEITLAKLENSNAKVLMDIEAMKCANDETQRFLDELTRQQDAGEAEVNALSNKFDKMTNEANKKQRQIDVLNTKINKAISRQGGVEASPEEIKIVTLEKNIAELRDKIRELQKFWLRQQGHVVSLSEQRQDQINDMNMLKKRMMLLIQRNLKLNDELDGYRKLEEKMDRNIVNLQNRLTVLNDHLCKKKGCKQSMVKDNDSIQGEYMSRLKDAELETIKIDSDITDIEEDKVNLSKELIEHNREALVWEKKIQMTVETKQNMDKERGEGGEIGTMKAEIHRMHVRFSQLKKAQDKLMHDLEHCVSRRDAIITLAEAREKREKGGSERTRINFTRKLDDMRNRVKQLENDVITIENKMDMAVKEAERLEIEIEMSRKEKEQVDEECKKMEYELELSQTEKQKNLETLVIKQKKLKVYSELYKKRYPYVVYKTESSIGIEYDKQREINCRLVIIVENLTTDFPTHLQTLTRIHNTLTLPFKYL